MMFRCSSFDGYGAVKRRLLKKNTKICNKYLAIPTNGVSIVNEPIYESPINPNKPTTHRVAEAFIVCW
jgi:hypothetical protein